MFNRRRDAALVTVYARPEGWYVISNVLTRDGAWLHRGEVTQPPSPAAVGLEVAMRLTQLAKVIRTPRDEDLPRRLEESQAPLLEAAGVSSWTEFVTDASLVQAMRTGKEVDVTKMRARRQPVGAFEPAGREHLDFPTSEEAAAAVERALN